MELETIHSFPPIVGKRPKVLILGTAPSVKSLEERQYYANYNNSFWKIMSRLLSFDSEENYEHKKICLEKYGVAIWDVYTSCQRKGSLDKNIKSHTINDFNGFLPKYPTLKLIVFNGKNAEKIYKKEIFSTLKEKQWQDVETISLPSTSSAYAKDWIQKLDEWSYIKEFLS